MKTLKYFARKERRRIKRLKKRLSIKKYGYGKATCGKACGQPVEKSVDKPAGSNKKVGKKTAITGVKKFFSKLFKRMDK